MRRFFLLLLIGVLSLAAIYYVFRSRLPASWPFATQTATKCDSPMNKYGIEFMQIPAGRFWMGGARKDQSPKHEVTIRSFCMGKYEVTQAQWQAVMGTNPSRFTDCGGDCPVEQVSWDDAQKFINKLNASNDGMRYRLPTEAEWEYACRAGTTGDYAGNLIEMAWFGNPGGKTHAVGRRQPNAWGLYDMHGNVWEWCEDRYHQNYDGAPTDGSAWVIGGPPLVERVVRGGSWADEASDLHAASRRSRAPERWNVVDHVRSEYDQGFRVVAFR